MTNDVTRLPGYLVSVLSMLIIGATAPEARADGGVLLGTTTLLNSGDTAQKVDLVFLGDGFTEGEQGTFNTRVDQAMAAFLDAHPLEALRSAFNVHRVNVSSPESGTDKFSTCGGTSSGDPDQTRQTAMDSGYCSGGGGSVYRCVFTTDSALALGFAANAPDDDIVIVLVNDTGWGGCAGGGLTFLTSTSKFPEIAVHELGHAIFGLADEYNYDGGDTFSGGEPGEANATINTDRSTLKWNELVLGGTSLPTQGKSNCSESGVPDRNTDEDIVGLYEGAVYSRCGVFRPQYACRMRASDQEFCAVCRRKIVRDLRDNLGDDLSVFFNNLLIRDDEDPWPKGEGEIWMDYDLRANGQQISGRWPASGESSFDDDDSKNINVFAGVLPFPAAGSSATVDVRLREDDWPDGDDSLSNDATESLPTSGGFTIDRADYRLTGEVRGAGLRVLLDDLNVKDDQDNFFAGSGDIYVEYTVSNGAQTVSGRWPSSDTVGMDDHDTRAMKLLAATIPVPSPEGSLSVRLRVMDEDSWFTGGDDELGDDTFTFGSAEDFGATVTTHVRDQSNYRITFTIAKNP